MRDWPEPPRQLPLNYEAEQALLGAILADNQAHETVASFLRAKHFAEPTHGRIFDACGALIERGTIANAITLKGHFDQEDALAEVGGAKYLAELQGNFVWMGHAKDYAQTIYDYYLRRELIAVGEELSEAAYDLDLGTSAAHLAETTEARLSDLMDGSRIGAGLHPIKGAAQQVVIEAEQTLAGGPPQGLQTGFRALDELTSGLFPGELTVLAGRPSMGKTALATNIASNAAAGGASVAFFSLEMPSRQIAGRMIAGQSGISPHRMRRGRFSVDDLQQGIHPAGAAVEKLPIFLDDTSALTTGAVRAGARRMKRRHGLALIVVDYLQIIGVPGNQRRNRVDDVTEITGALKATAKDLDVPVLALSQLSRKVEDRDDKRPMLSDLRDSGSIEQDADCVVFIYRQAYYEERREPRQKVGEGSDKFSVRYAEWRADLDQIADRADLIVAKSRNGPPGEVKLRFDANLCRFRDDHEDAREAAA